MKTWIIAAMILGVLVIGGFAVVSAISNSNNADTAKDTGTQATETISCSSCGNGCTAQSNCGRATCGAVTGTGTCGCGK